MASGSTAVNLRPDEATKLHRIPITTPARTLLDLAAELHPRALEQAASEADRRHLTTRSGLAALLARHPRRPGSRALRALVETR